MPGPPAASDRRAGQALPPQHLKYFKERFLRQWLVLTMPHRDRNQLAVDHPVYGIAHIDPCRGQLKLQGRRLGQIEVSRHGIAKPPLTLNTCPVIQEARSLARNAIADATSLGSPSRPVG